MTDTLYGIWGSTLTGIANSIRTKNPDVSGLVDPADMEQDILDIPSGGGGEPYIPMKIKISEFDFTSNTPWNDLVKNVRLGTLMHYGTATQGVGLEFKSTGQRVRTGTIFDFCGIYEMEVKFGTFNKENAPNTGNNFLLCFSRNNYTAMLCFKNYDSETGQGDWWIHDQTSNNIYLDDIHDPYYFENKTLTVLCGAKIVDGEIVKDTNKIYYYVNGVQLNSNGAILPGDVDNSVGIVHLGDRSSATFKGAVFEGFKIYQYRYDLSDNDDIIQPLSITANGTYTADGVNVAGYSPVTANISEVLESEFDLLHCNSTDGYPDLIKKVKLPSNRYTSFANGYLTSNGGYVNMTWSNCGDIKRFVVQMGTFDRNQEPQQQYMGLFTLCYGNQGTVMYYDNDNDRWLVRDSGGTEYVSGNDLPKYAFENATVEIVYGAKYIDGALYRGRKVNGTITENYANYVTMYIHASNNQEYIVEYTAQLSADRPDYMFSCTIGTGGSAWLGALFENAKVYNVMDCYDKYYEEVTE